MAHKGAFSAPLPGIDVRNIRVLPVALRKPPPPLCLSVSLCLSRACLGKLIVSMHTWLKQRRFRTQPMVPCTNRLLFQRFLCVSRACLGQMIVFSTKLLQKRRPSHPVGGGLAIEDAACRNVSLFQRFLCLFRACLGKYSGFSS